MKIYFLTVMLLITVLLGADADWAQPEGTPGRGKTGFEKLKSLAGEWQAQGPHGLATVTYQVVAGGTAVLETIIPPDEPSMVTLYHLDGDRLAMTHYCSSGNQPRMRAEAPAGETKNLKFALVEVTNLARPADGHMVNLVFTFHDNDHLTQVWTWRQEGRETQSTFVMARNKSIKN